MVISRLAGFPSVERSSGPLPTSSILFGECAQSVLSSIQKRLRCAVFSITLIWFLVWFSVLALNEERPPLGTYDFDGQRNVRVWYVVPNFGTFFSGFSVEVFDCLLMNDTAVRCG